MASITTSNPKWMLELGPKRIGNHTNEEICEILTNVPWALKFIKDPTPEWIMLACKKNYQAISFVEDPSVELQAWALKHDKSAISMIKKLDEDLAVAMLLEDPMLIHQITNPTPIMITIAGIMK